MLRPEHCPGGAKTAHRSVLDGVTWYRVVCELCGTSCAARDQVAGARELHDIHVVIRQHAREHGH